MDGFNAWDLLKAVFLALFGLVLWTWQKEVEARKDHEKRIKALETYVEVRTARTELWKELGKPERRDDLPDTDFR